MDGLDVLRVELGYGTRYHASPVTSLDHFEELDGFLSFGQKMKQLTVFAVSERHHDFVDSFGILSQPKSSLILISMS